MTLPALLALLVVALATPLSWAVVVMLWRQSLRRPGNKVLRAQAWASLALAVIVTVFAIVFVNNEQAVPPLSPEQTQILTRGVLLIVSVASSLYWIRLYRKQS